MLREADALKSRVAHQALVGLSLGTPKLSTDIILEYRDDTDTLNVERNSLEDPDRFAQIASRFAWNTSPKWTISASASARREWFAGTDLSRDQFATQISLDFAYSPKTNLSLGVQSEQIVVEAQSERNWSRDRLFGRMRWAATPKLSLGTAFGADRVDGELQSASALSPAISADLAWLYLPGSSVMGYSRLERRISRTGAGEEFREARHGIFLRQAIAREYYISADAALSFRDYELGRSERELSLLAAVGWRLRAFVDRSTTAEIYYRRRQIESDTFPTVWYTESGVRVTLEF